MSNSTQPGWYLDTAADAPPGRQRYWDGSRWSDQFYDPPAAAGVAVAAPVRALREPDPHAAAVLPLANTVGLMAAAGLVAALMRKVATESFDGGAFVYWLTAVVLPVGSFSAVAGLLRKVTRWDLVARNAGIAAGAATVAVFVLDRAIGPSYYAGEFVRTGPIFLGWSGSVSDWLRNVVSIMLTTAAVSAAAAAAVFWHDRARLPFAVVGAAAAAGVLAMAASPIRADIRVILPPLWFAATAAGAALAPVLVDRRIERAAAAVAAGAPIAGAPPVAGIHSAGVLPYELASIGARFGARVIDSLLFVVAEVVVIAAALASGTAEVAIVLLAIFFLAAILWDPLWLANGGATPGKRMVKICVVREDNGQPIGAGKAFGRTFLPLAWMWIPGVNVIISMIAVLTAFGDPKRRTWMDKAAGTVVVRRSSAASPPVAFPVSTPVVAAPPAVAPPVVAAPVASPPPAFVVPLHLAGAPALNPPPSTAPKIDVNPIIEQVPFAVPFPAAGDAPTLAPPAQSQPAESETIQYSPGMFQRRAYTLNFSTGARVELSGGRLLVGRDPDAQGDTSAQRMAVHDPERRISRTHLVFTLAGPTLSVEDAGSANGSAVVDPRGVQSPLTPGVAIDLTPGCRVLFGGCSVTID